MNTKKTRRIPGRARIGLTLTAGLAILALGAFGCAEDDLGLTSPAGAADPVALQSSPPTLAELASATGISAAESENLRTHLEAWRGQHAARGTRGSVDGAGDPPILRFLEASAGVLDQEGFVSVATYLSTREGATRQTRLGNERSGPRAEARGQRGRRPGGPGQGGPGGDGSGLGGPGRGGPGADLGLTEEQHAALREAMKESREAGRVLTDQYRNGEIDEAALTDGLNAIRAEVVSRLGSALTGDQMTQLQEAKDARMVERAQRKLEHVGQRTERRIEFLTVVLKLNDEQASQITGFLNDAVAQETALLESVIAGTTEGIDAMIQGLVLKHDTQAAVRGVLDDDQIERLDAMKGLLGKGRRHGPRR